MNVTVLRPVSNYIAWWQKHIGVNNLPKVVMQLYPGRNWTHNLLITSPTPYSYAPPRTRIAWKQLKTIGVWTDFVNEFSADTVWQVAKKRFQQNFHRTSNITIIICWSQCHQYQHYTSDTCRPPSELSQLAQAILYGSKFLSDERLSANVASALLQHLSGTLCSQLWLSHII